MGRQVLWGGKGKPPSREVMNAAAKAARGEMLQRMRENKDKQGGSGQRRNGNGQSRPQQPQGGQQARPAKSANGARNGNVNGSVNGNGNGARTGNGARNGNG